ncbi:AraC family transcriptional regulator [Pseudomonas sp. ICMP 8385]|uniref:AraC family transcriptional regulator n=1 Tax=Pseudomonas sp. ICMP 8385 TaxID=1718920 RepID=UPI000C075485|nr:AraC family transcriptional regulator [Pseudomonas sp. ICMP 8385]
MTKTPKNVLKRHDSVPFKKDIRDPAADVFFDIFSKAEMCSELLPDRQYKTDEKQIFNGEIAYFHIVHHGVFLLYPHDTKEPISLSPGDIIFAPSGISHCIQFQGVSSENAEHACPEPTKKITSGFFKFDSVGGQALMLGLPKFLHVSSRPSIEPDTLGSKEWLALTVAAMQKEMALPSIGSAIMLSRIIDLMFIWAIRNWLFTAPAEITGWIAALRDSMVGHALALLHSEPGADWTVEKLALEVGQSRSNFANKFGRMVGDSPMRYLTRWRMQLAGKRLRSSNQRVSKIAEDLGYDSDVAFSRAFRRELGLTPTEYRLKYAV